MNKTALFIDRDGTILVEPADEQIDSFEKFQFVPGVIRNLNFIRTKLDRSEESRRGRFRQSRETHRP